MDVVVNVVTAAAGSSVDIKRRLQRLLRLTEIRSKKFSLQVLVLVERSSTIDCTHQPPPTQKHNLSLPIILGP
jgi:hypothetical protein